MESESPNDPIDAEESLEAVEPIEAAEVSDPEVAEVADASEVVDGARYAETASQEIQPLVSHQLPPQFQNVAAKGGAVGALVLGFLAVFGAFVTQWSLFNAVVGLMLGFWGLSSTMSRTALVGIVLCGIGLTLCVTLPGFF